MIRIDLKIHLTLILLSVLLTSCYGNNYSSLTKNELIQKIHENIDLCKIYFKRKFDKDVDVICLTEYKKLTKKELIRKLNEYPILFEAYNFVEEFGPDASTDGSRHQLDLYDYPEDYAPSSHNRHRISLWQCLIGCQHEVYQQIARRRVEQGLRLYNKNKQKAAILKWHSALKQIRKKNDKFILLGYLYHAYIGLGKYRQSLEYAHGQLSIAEDMDSPNLRAEAYLNLAKTEERMGNLKEALEYARHSLYNECDHCRTAGLVQITVGSVHLELATFCKALKAFQQAHTIAQRIQDRSLELQVYMCLSELFGRLQDADKSAMYASKAYNLCRTLHVNELNSRYHRAALLQMASALRKQGELGDAHDYCSEATRLALVSGDQPCYAKSIRIMGDIYRKKMEIGNAYRQYESAMNSAYSMGDRLCQIEAMDGAAKCLEVLRIRQKICSCRPLDFNNKLLETASKVGAKLLIRAIRIRLCKICESLGDTEQNADHEREIHHLEGELEMVCGSCNNPFGLEPDSLDVLPCTHILHAKCLYDILRRKDKKKNRTCPDCQRIITSKLYLERSDSPHRSSSSYSINTVPTMALEASSIV